MYPIGGQLLPAAARLDLGLVPAAAGLDLGLVPAAAGLDQDLDMAPV